MYNFSSDWSFDFSKRNHADDIIDELTEKVLALYPQERLERIKARSQASWKDMGKGCPYYDRISYVVLKQPPEGDPKIPEDASGIQREMIFQLKTMIHNSVIDDEYFPAYQSGLEQVTIPSMFGCVKESISDSAHIKPVISSPSDIYSLPEADIREGSVCHDILYRMAYKHRRTKGRIPVYMTDIQGPFSCAAQMWGIQDFLCVLDENPNEVHHLLSLTTNAIIKYIRAMYEAVDGDMIPIHCHPVLWIPRDCGIAASDDFFAVAGPHTVRDFSVPYLEKLGEEFGGVTVHTCGSMNHLVKLMNTMKTLKAVNFGITETNLPEYAGECDPRIMLIVHKSKLSVNGLPFLTIEKHLRLCADVQRKTGVRVFATPQYTDEPVDETSLKLWEEAARL